MAISFNADEILQMAEQIERNGAKFYRKAANSIKQPENRDLLLNLAAMEDDHETTFAAMRAELPPEARQPTVFDPDDQGALYLQAMANRRVFDVQADPGERLTGQEAVEDILQIAIGLEKDSIVFYLGLKNLIPEKLGQGRVDDIIREEMKHIALLSSHLPA